jgi:GTP-binding protein EngB required for normal cell division
MGSVNAQLPEIIHIFTKRDRMGFEGFKRQIANVEALRDKGFVDKYFFVSSVSQFNVQELKQYLLDYKNEYENTDI